MNAALFVSAMRKKLRFPTTKGMTTTEDLWDFSLQSLDRLATTVHNALEASKTSFVKPSSKKKASDQDWQLMLDIIKEVIAVKESEETVPEQAKPDPEHKIIL